MIDTHAHLDFPEFDQDREEVISRFFENGGRAIVNIGVDLERSRKSIEIAEGHEGIFASVGLHPDFFSKGDWGDRGDWVSDLKKMARHKKVVAIGETGLDYYRIGPPPLARLDYAKRARQACLSGEAGESGEIGKIRERQKEGFLAQIEIAKELGLPVIVHCREAWKDLYEIISGFSQSSAFPFRERSSRNSSKPSFSRFVLHCYSGEKKDTEKFLELPNVFFSFSGNITYPKPVERAEELVEAVRMIPLERMMLDSDAPFLAPQVFRGKRNEPAYVKHIAQKIAEIKGISVEEIERVTDENAAQFFGI